MGDKCCGRHVYSAWAHALPPWVGNPSTVLTGWGPRTERQSVAADCRELRWATSAVGNIFTTRCGCRPPGQPQNARPLAADAPPADKKHNAWLGGARSACRPRARGGRTASGGLRRPPAASPGATGGLSWGLRRPLLGPPEGLRGPVTAECNGCSYIRCLLGPPAGVDKIPVKHAVVKKRRLSKLPASIFTDMSAELSTPASRQGPATCILYIRPHAWASRLRSAIVGIYPTRRAGGLRRPLLGPPAASGGLRRPPAVSPRASGGLSWGLRRPPAHSPGAPGTRRPPARSACRPRARGGRTACRPEAPGGARTAFEHWRVGRRGAGWQIAWPGMAGPNYSKGGAVERGFSGIPFERRAQKIPQEPTSSGCPLGGPAG